MRPLTPSGRGTHRDTAAVSASVVKVGVLGALATATIAVPIASATGAQHTDVAAAVPASGGGAQGAVAASRPVAIPAVSTDASTGLSSPIASQNITVTPGDGSDDEGGATTSQDVAADTTPDNAVPSAEGFIHPVNAPVTSGYGYRVHPTLGYEKMHDGIDFGAACGTPVKAAAAGTVVKAEASGASGNRIDIDHGNGVVTGYFHLSGYQVSVGQTVQQGQVIGLTGSTGRSTGCHLHFAELDRSGAYSDPDSLFR